MQMVIRNALSSLTKKEAKYHSIQNELDLLNESDNKLEISVLKQNKDKKCKELIRIANTNLECIRKLQSKQ